MKKILFVDDSMYMRSLLKRILTSEHFQCAGEAQDGEEAVRKYLELRPDLVTMDIIMPNMNGIEAVRRIREHDPEAKIIMVSAMGQQALVIEAIQAGARDFIIKPFQPGRVLEALRRVFPKNGEAHA